MVGIRQFIAVALVAFTITTATPLTAQVADSASSPVASYVDPGEATMWAAFFPGAGHLLAGETEKGVALLVGSVAAPTIEYALTARSCAVDVSTWRSSCSMSYAYLGWLGFAAIYGYSILDAGPAARRANRRNGFGEVAARVQPLVEPAASGGTSLGIRLAF